MTSSSRRLRLGLASIFSVGVFVTPACDDPDFGDKALGFVNGELHEMSLSLAKADLAIRWPRTVQLLLLDVDARFSNIFDVTRRLHAETSALRSDDSTRG